MIATLRDQDLLLTARPFASAPTVPGPSGVGGVAIYRSVNLTGGDPPPIAYRHLRFTRGGGQALFRSHRRKTEADSLVNQPATAATVAVVPGASYRLNVRPWRDDVENPQTYGEQVSLVDADGNTTPLIEGGGYVLQVQKRQAGGMRLTVIWNSPPSAPPQTITLDRISGPTSVASVSLSWSATQRAYVFVVSGLQDAGVYVFRITAARSGFTILAKAAFGATETDVTFVADASGPGPVTALISKEA